MAGGLRGPYGPDGASPPRGREWQRQTMDGARKELRDRVKALVESPEWELVARGIRGQRAATAHTIAAGVQLSEPEMRELQGRYLMLTDLLVRPVELLCQYDETEGGER